MPAILDSLEHTPNLVIHAPPGSGKTTRVPPALLRAGFLKPTQEVVVLVPRRLAAKMAALRVAEEMGEAVGKTVGYQFRFENVTSAATRLRFVTEGLLLRQLMHAPTLPNVGCVVLDEFHERHLHADVAIAYLRFLQQVTRPDLRLVVMSATLDSKAVADFLGDAPVMSVATSPYPVVIHYQVKTAHSKHSVTTRDVMNLLPQQIVDVVARLQNKPRAQTGDVLVFLPGMAEIRRAAEALQAQFGDTTLILPLHGDLPKEDQALVFRETEKRKIILATNVAETSLTIPGVATVIDAGLHRQASYSWWSGVPALKTKPISQASATQRAGRAGRTAPGACYRLYTEGDFLARPAFETSEIRRCDLAQTLLEIKAMGVVDVASFPFFEAPNQQSLEAATELLYNLGAFTENNLNSALTTLGHKMAILPLHPRFARVLIAAEEAGVLEPAIKLVAYLSEGRDPPTPPLIRGVPKAGGSAPTLDIFDELEKSFVSDAVKKQMQVLRGLFSPSPLVGEGARRAGEGAVRVLKMAILRGFPDRVARKRATPADTKRPHADLIFCAGGAGTVTASDVVQNNEYFVILDVSERQHLSDNKAKLHVRSLSAIAAEDLLDLATTFLAEKNTLIYDERKQRVVEVSELCYGQLVLSASVQEPRDGKAALTVLFKAVLGLDAEFLARLSAADFLIALQKKFETTELESFFARLKLAREHQPQFAIPDFSDDGFGQAIMTLLQGAVQLSDLAPQNLIQKMSENFDYDVQAFMPKELPLKINLPEGRSVSVNYELGKAPWIQSRLQDFFGMTRTPTILMGRVPLTIHLLAPNKRAVQVTQDLASFWQKVYPEIRPQLSRRYPRHKWL